MGTREAEARAASSGRGGQGGAARSIIRAASPYLFLVDNLSDPIREHSICSGEHVERFPQQDDLSIGYRAVAEETLMDEPPGVLIQIASTPSTFLGVAGGHRAE
jgi:hypothetical protein